MLEFVYLSLWKVKVQSVTVVELGMYDRSGDGVDCFEVKVGANVAQLTNVMVAGPRAVSYTHLTLPTILRV